MENKSIMTVMTRSDSATSMSITDALALSPTNRLTPAERKAFSKSDHKASKGLGIALTRNDVGPVQSPDQENAQGGNILGDMMALISAKRARSRNASTVTIVGPFRGLGLGLVGGRMGMGVVEKRNKKRRVAGDYTQRVVLGPLCSNESPSKEGLSTAGRDGSSISVLERDEGPDPKTPVGGVFGGHDEEEEDLFGGSASSFVWDVENPFTTPPNAVLQRRFEEMRLSENIGPLDVAPTVPVASLDGQSNFEESEEDNTALCSSNWSSDPLRPSERAWLDGLIAQDKAEDEPRERRRAKRAASRNKMLNVLGAEARQVVDGQYCHTSTD